MNEIRLNGPVLEDYLQTLNHLFIDIARLRYEQGYGEIVGGYCELKVATLDSGIPAAKLVAAKRLRLGMRVTEPKRLAFRLARELKVWAGLQHPHVLPLLGFYLDKDYKTAVLISEYMNHGDLKDYISKMKPPSNERLCLARDLTEGLTYLHRQQAPIRHGDLKPGNVLVNESRRAVLADFGLSRALDAGPTGFTTGNDARGTVRYSSPEVLLLGTEAVSLSNDIWSWGCLVFEALTDRIPFPDIQAEPQLIIALVQGKSPNDTKNLSAFPQQLGDLLAECWSREPGQRPAVVGCLHILELAVSGLETRGNFSITELARAPNYHAPPFSRSSDLHHPPRQHVSHPPPSQLPAYPVAHPASDTGGSSSYHFPSNQHFPPLASQGPYPIYIQDNSLPPLSPYNQRPPYPLSTSFPPPLSRLPSQHQVPPHSPPPPPFYQQPPSWYYPPLPSSHDHGHWSSQQNGRHDPPRLPSPIAAEPWETEDTGAPADDFIKTLAKMLDDPYCSQIVSWGPKGDCFVVKDMTEFARFILPRMFKHSNYTSFVRQLNKYDFRQIKNSDEFGDQCWTFQHPDFQRSNSDAMENIKWKVPVQRKAMRERAATRPNLPWSASDAAIGGDGLGKVIVTDGDERPLFPHLNGVAGMSYSGSTVSVDSNSILVNGSSSELSSMERPFLARPEPMRRLEEPIRAHKARNAAAFAELPPLTPELPLAERSFFARQESMQRPEELNRAHEGRNGVDVAERPPSPPELSPAELSFLIRQEPMRRMEELKCARKARDAAVVAELPPFTPAWAVPPRVLLVEDDQVSRHKFSKFLQVSGCTIDVAVDGVGAVNKMSVEKYDLVLMDTVLPTLDGVSATSVIRQFDRMTPIIAMASDSKPKDIATYYASGMNDILAKPFTQESLFTMLEKHLTHLKADDMVRPVREEPSKVLTEDRDSMPIEALLRRIDGVDYFPPPAPTTGNVVALTNPITRARKRALETVDDDREGKRSRFEVVE